VLGHARPIVVFHLVIDGHVLSPVHLSYHLQRPAGRGRTAFAFGAIAAISGT
jgi:hypothetical protein